MNDIRLLHMPPHTYNDYINVVGYNCDKHHKHKYLAESSKASTIKQQGPTIYPIKFLRLFKGNSMSANQFLYSDFLSSSWLLSAETLMDICKKEVKAGYYHQYMDQNLLGMNSFAQIIFEFISRAFQLNIKFNYFLVRNNHDCIFC